MHTHTHTYGGQYGNTFCAIEHDSPPIWNEDTNRQTSVRTLPIKKKGL